SDRGAGRALPAAPQRQTEARSPSLRNMALAALQPQVSLNAGRLDSGALVRHLPGACGALAARCSATAGDTCSAQVAAQALKKALRPASPASGWAWMKASQASST